MQFLFFKEVTSTQTTAIEIAKQGQQTPFCVIAESQTQGKGRFERQWISQQGNLFATFIFLAEDISVPNLTPYYAGLSVLNAITSLLSQENTDHNKNHSDNNGNDGGNGNGDTKHNTNHNSSLKTECMHTGYGNDYSDDSYEYADCFDDNEGGFCNNKDKIQYPQHFQNSTINYEQQSQNLESYIDYNGIKAQIKWQKLTATNHNNKTHNQGLEQIVGDFDKKVTKIETSHHLKIKEIKIKWPNDILINGCKVAGILTQRITDKDKSFIAIGVGLNIINNPDLAETKTNLTIEVKTHNTRLDNKTKNSAFLEDGGKYEWRQTSAAKGNLERKKMEEKIKTNIANDNNTEIQVNEQTSAAKGNLKGEGGLFKTLSYKASNLCHFGLKTTTQEMVEKISANLEVLLRQDFKYIRPIILQHLHNYNKITCIQLSEDKATKNKIDKSGSLINKNQNHSTNNGIKYELNILGKIVDVDKDGLLVIKLEDGSKKLISFGDVS